MRSMEETWLKEPLCHSTVFIVPVNTCPLQEREADFLSFSSRTQSEPNRKCEKPSRKMDLCRAVIQFEEGRRWIIKKNLILNYRPEVDLK